MTKMRRSVICRIEDQSRIMAEQKCIAIVSPLRLRAQGETWWANAVAFDEAAQAELLRLKAGEALAIQGTMKVGVYGKNGEHRASLSIVGEHVLALRGQQRRSDCPRADVGGSAEKAPTRAIWPRCCPHSIRFSQSTRIFQICG